MNDPFSIDKEEKKLFLKNESAGEEIEPLSRLKGEALKLVINERVRLIFLIVLFVLIGLIFIRLFSLQILGGTNYLKMAESNKVSIERIAANRGIIYDRYMNPLVKNSPKSFLYISPQLFPAKIEERKTILEKIEKIIGPIDDLPMDFKETEELFILKENLTQEEKILFEVEKNYLPGIILEIKSGREYIAGEEFSHLMGYTGRVSKEDLDQGYSLVEEIGKTGIEEYYEDWLRGKAGKRRIESVGDNNQLETIFEAPEDGKNIVLSIDAELQKVLASSLKNWTKSSGGKAGAAVVLSPQDGEILAIISYPFFDNNLFSQGISKMDYQKIISNPNKPLFFRALSGEYQPGSTVKPVIGLAALEEKIIDEKTSFMSTGGIWAGKWFFADWKPGGHGLTNLKKSLAESVNTFFYIISAQNDFFNGLGPEKIALYLRSFGLGQKTNLDLSSEASGFIPTPKWKEETKNEIWFVGDSYNLGIGHGDLRVTPLQMAVLTAAVATEGKMVKPHFVKKIFDSNNQEKNIEIKSWQLPFKKENYSLIKEGMREAVVSGTAKGLNSFPLEVAGKTGTIEVEGQRTHSWFVSFAPMDDPTIVISVIVENGGEGSGPALRVAKETLEWWYQHRYLNK